MIQGIYHSGMPGLRAAILKGENHNISCPVKDLGNMTFSVEAPLGETIQIMVAYDVPKLPHLPPAIEVIATISLLPLLRQDRGLIINQGEDLIFEGFNVYNIDIKGAVVTALSNQPITVTPQGQISIDVYPVEPAGEETPRNAAHYKRLQDAGFHISIFLLGVESTE